MAIVQRARARACELAKTNVPEPPSVVPPLKLLLPLKRVLPAPLIVSPPVPLIVPANEELALPLPMPSVAAPSKIDVPGLPVSAPTVRPLPAMSSVPPVSVTGPVLDPRAP